MLNPLKDPYSKIELIKASGGDLDVINAAKASFDNVADMVEAKGIKLIHYLVSPIASPQHTSPLRGVSFTFRVSAPLFICRQWWKHTVASTYVDEQSQWNEQSLRYKDITREAYYVPTEFKQQSSANKQASEKPVSEEIQKSAELQYRTTCENSYLCYRQLRDMGVSREQARGVLVPAFYTSFQWTVSLQSLLHFIDLRSGHGAQAEIVAYANAIAELIGPFVPHTINAWQIRKNRIEEMVELYNQVCQETIV